jgi:hypothetical protein
VKSNPFLDSPDPLVRRRALVVYCIASGVVGRFFGGGLSGSFLELVVGILFAVAIWWLVAGIGLRIVRRMSPHDLARK